MTRRLTRIEAATLISREFFQISPRTLERWPLTVRRLNGRATFDESELRRLAKRLVSEAPEIRTAT